jgi:PhnB protein
MNVQPYLYFDGRSQEAIDFYKGAIGAKVEMIMHFKDAPAEVQSQIKPGMADKVMHACIKVGDTPVFVSDGNCNEASLQFQGITLTINADSDAEADKLFGALGNGGQIQMPMAETFFASRFGMVADKFGVSWMVLAAKKTT